MTHFGIVPCEYNASIAPPAPIKNWSYDYIPVNRARKANQSKQIIMKTRQVPDVINYVCDRLDNDPAYKVLSIWDVDDHFVRSWKRFISPGGGVPRKVENAILKAIRRGKDMPQCLFWVSGLQQLGYSWHSGGPSAQSLSNVFFPMAVPSIRRCSPSFLRLQGAMHSTGCSDITSLDTIPGYLTDRTFDSTHPWADICC